MIELIDKRTESSKTYALGGNKRALEIFSGLVHYKDDYSNPLEQWKDIDTTIVKGKVTKAPYELTIDSDNLTLTVRDKKTGDTTTVKLKGIPPGLLNKVAPVTSSNKMTFSEVISGLDLVIETSPEGVAFKRVIKNSTVPHKAEFEILQNRPDSSLKVTYKAKDSKARLLHEQIPVTVIKSGNVVTEDIDLAKVKDIQYPLEIDPNITLQPSSKDNWMYNAAATTNYGSSANLRAYWYNSDNIIRGLLEFDNPWGTGEGKIPLSATLNTATLSLYAHTVAGSGTYKVQRLLRLDWVEAESTWNIYKTGSDWTTAGAASAGNDYTADDEASLAISTTGWKDWNVLNQVKWAQTNDKSIAFRWISGETGAYHEALAYSREGTPGDITKRPKLYIDYSLPPAWANIAKVSGATAADLAKVNGIAVADIAKWNGAAV